jgi:hypothetical protein
MPKKNDYKNQENKNNLPSISPVMSTAVALPELDLMKKIFEQIELETAKIVEELFEYLFDVDDFSVIGGNIPLPKNASIKGYIKSLNKLFKLSRASGVSFRLINRRMVRELDKKTYLFCMCVDGGISLDVLCEVVNQENMARTPTASPVRITVKQIAADEKTHQIGK